MTDSKGFRWVFGILTTVAFAFLAYYIYRDGPAMANSNGIRDLLGADLTEETELAYMAGLIPGGITLLWSIIKRRWLGLISIGMFVLCCVVNMPVLHMLTYLYVLSSYIVCMIVICSKHGGARATSYSTTRTTHAAVRNAFGEDTEDPSYNPNCVYGGCY